MIEARNVTFRYRSAPAPALDSVSLSVPAGQAVGVLGHNGAGKTTLLKVLYGLLQQESGTVVLSIASYADVFLLTDRMGLADELTLRESLAFVSRVRGEDPEIVLASGVIDRFELRRHLDEPVSRLSAGMQLRADLAAGLAARPRLILLDEPSHSLDPVSRKVLEETVVEQRDAGATVLLVTHDLELAHGACDRLVILQEGRVVLDSPSTPGPGGLADLRDTYFRITKEHADESPRSDAPRRAGWRPFRKRPHPEGGG